MNLEEYRERFRELKSVPTTLTEYRQKIADLMAEYLSEQAVPDAETAAKLICEAQERGELPELKDPTNPENWSCELREVFEDESPDKRQWRCRTGWYFFDVQAEDGAITFISA